MRSALSASIQHERTHCCGERQRCAQAHTSHAERQRRGDLLCAACVGPAIGHEKGGAAHAEDAAGDAHAALVAQVHILADVLGAHHQGPPARVHLAMNHVILWLVMQFLVMLKLLKVPFYFLFSVPQTFSYHMPIATGTYNPACHPPRLLTCRRHAHWLQ